MNFDILYEKIKEYDKIMIFGHVRPDGDCYGSLNGLKDIIKTSFPKKRVFCLTSQVEFLSFVGKMDDVEDEEFIDSLAIICDTSTRERICDKRYTLCKEKIFGEATLNEFIENMNNRCKNCARFLQEITGKVWEVNTNYIDISV